MRLAVAASAGLAIPRIARAGASRPLRFVPTNALAVLDPSIADTPFLRVHAYLVFDTLYGLDDYFRSHPQMVQGTRSRPMA